MTAYYRELGDGALAEAFGLGPSGYEPAVWKILEAEARTRSWPRGADAKPVTPAVLLHSLQVTKLTAAIAEAEQRATINKVIVVVGIGVTFGSFLLGTGGGTYVFAGAMVFGAIRGSIAMTEVSKLKAELAELEQPKSGL